MSWKPSDYAWAAIATEVLVFDLLAAEGDTLSERADSYMVHHPWLVRFVALTLAGHICNLWPEKLDGIHWMFVGMRKLRHHTP